MEDDYRQFQPLKLDIAGIETGRERYLRDGWYQAPQIANWRNNLTACSQRHNLYFIAHQDRLAVFQPSFPSHILGRQAQINITPTLANPYARGALDPSRPHGINHLIVGELGSEEILFLSTDSGNVAAYHTAAIQDGIHKEPYKFSQEGPSDLVGVRPFFTHWVHESAWGLSIHKNARMLAVSSNKPRHQGPTSFNAVITVFAFALTIPHHVSLRARDSEMACTEEDESEWKLWACNPENPKRKPDRSLNWKTRLEAHTCNIPSVSFVNSDDDREGSYLLSTDIEGITKCWHIWQGNVTYSWDFSAPIHGLSNRYHNSRQNLSGWTVLALDPSSFQVVNSHEAFCGDPTDLRDLLGYIDITSSLRRIPVHERSLTAENYLPSLGSDSDQSSNEPPYQSGAELSEEDDQDAMSAGNSPQLANSIAIMSEPMHDHSDSSSDELSQVEGDETNEIEGGDEITVEDFFRLDGQAVEDEDSFPDWPDFSIPGGYYSSAMYESQVGTGGAKKVKLHHPGTLPAYEQRVPSSNAPIIPTLHLSASHLRLFDAKRPEEASVYCSEPLSFQWPTYYANHPDIDRLNLTQYIPELGIVVIGTQIGRVAVCSLTRRGFNGPFGLRVDWILPLKSQEKKRQRPLTHLLGIAVGPVQGHQHSRSSSTSEEDEEVEDTWLQDRTDEDGVSITFDRELIKLGQNSSTSTTSSGAPRPHPTPPRSSRANPRDKAKKPERKRSPPVIVQQAWPSRAEAAESAAVNVEAWRGLEYSRRYRLMLTYYDQTVMTYELSRTAPFVGDPGVGRQNWGNRDEFW